jgi:hypothetical protein
MACQAQQPLRSAKLIAVCGEKASLLRAYDDAVTFYSSRVSTLRLRAGTAPEEDYRAMLGEAESARKNLDRERKALDEHIAGHHC